MKRMTRKSLGNGHYIYSADFRQASEWKRSNVEAFCWFLFFIVVGMFSLYFITWILTV